MRRLLMTFGLLLAASAASAEVCAVFDTAKNFVRLSVNTDPDHGILWAKLSAVPDSHCVNLGGDVRGDKAPAHTVIAMPDEPLIEDRVTVGPETRGRLIPVVVWPRTDGSDWEIFYALWDYPTERWTTAAYVDRVENFADDLDPVIEVVDDKLKLRWTHTTSTQLLTLGSDGTVLTLGYHDILWSPPYLIAVGTPIEITTLPVGPTPRLGTAQP